MLNINKSHIIRHFERALPTYEQHASMQRYIAEQLPLLLASHLPSRLHRVLEIGCGTGILTRSLLNHFSVDELFINDIAPSACASTMGELRQSFPAVACSDLTGDAENGLAFPVDVDLVASASTVQWFQQPDYFFEKVDRALSLGGMLAFNTFGADNFCEIRRLTGNGLDYLQEDRLTALLASRFEVVEQRVEVHRQLFDSPIDVLHHIRMTGVAVGSNFVWTKAKLADFEENYRKLYTTNGQVTLTWHVLYYLCRKKIAI